MYKPGKEWGRLWEWCSSWSGCLSHSHYTKLWARRRLWHGDRNSRRSYILLPWNVFRQTEKTRSANPQWKHPCDHRSRPNFVGPSTVGKQQHFCKFQYQNSQNFQSAEIANDNNPTGYSGFFMVEEFFLRVERAPRAPSCPLFFCKL